MESDQQIIQNLKEDLKSKSIEELIYLNFNPSFYIEKSTQTLRQENEKLLADLNDLNKSYQTNKVQYDNIINMLNNYKNQYGIKERELYKLIEEKKKVDGQLTVEGLQNALKSHIENKFAKPKQQLINDFLAGKVGLDEFTEKFKQLNLNLHYYSIIKDKLNLYK